MKNYFYIAILFLSCISRAQSPEETQTIGEQQLEDLTEKKDADIEDDSYLQRLDEYHKHRLSLNVAKEDELRSIGILTDLQIKDFFRYRELLGKLITVYELQAVPGWDIETIRQLLPYIIVDDKGMITETLRRRWKAGDHILLFRESQVLERSRGFGKPADPSASYYLGSPQRVFFRYSYNYKNCLQYGLLGDKDAGEQFFRGYQRYGFDFYSFHFFLSKLGIIRSLALGNFTVNMGQGLIQWQGLAFTKSANVLAIKRQAAILRPYHSAGEFNFHRGAGLTLQKKNWEATGFISVKNVSANLTVDTLDEEDALSSFESSGYHRTVNENADKNNIRQTAIGGSIGLSGRGGHVGINAIHYHFSNPVQKQNLPYNLFAIRGKNWSDVSLDYSYTYQNLHLFGELAMDGKGHRALVCGALASLCASLDAAFLYRNIAAAYQSLYADAFTENTSANNEKGWYTGLSLRPFPGWRLDGFFDIYTFSWLKYRVDAPGYGADFLAQLFYQPSKEWSVYIHFKKATKRINQPGADLATHPLALIPHEDWRAELNVKLSNSITVKSRFESVSYDKKGAGAEHGFLNLLDLFYHPHGRSYAGNLRLQWFETDGYNSRVYVFEHDVLYSSPSATYYDKGFRYYININGRLSRLFHQVHAKKTQWEGWLRWSQVIYPGKTAIGTGLDQITGNRRSEIKFQLMLSW